jgi:diguanylate cyclase (GGDEF)-like protein
MDKTPRSNSHPSGWKRLIRSVLLLDREGKPVHACGEFPEIQNALEDTRLGSIKGGIKSCLKGKPFHGKFKLFGNRENVEVHGEPLRSPDGDVSGVCLVLEEEADDRLEPVNELDFLIQNMRQGMWRLSPFGIVTFVNPYMAEWLDTTPDKIVGQHFSRFRRLGIVAPHDEEAGLSQRYVTEFTTAKGRVRRAIVVTSPVVDPATGEPNGTVDLITDITAQHEQHTLLTEEVQKMARLASQDPLTGVSNRMVFDSMLDTLTAAADVTGFGVIIVDVDNFKEMGDQVLLRVAQRLQEGVREQDVVTRIGGDEFAVLLPDTTPEHAADVASRLIDQLDFRMFGEFNFRVSLSVGCAHSGLHAGDILVAADSDMYRFKRERKAKMA